MAQPENEMSAQCWPFLSASPFAATEGFTLSRRIQEVRGILRYSMERMSCFTSMCSLSSVL